jgi:hypothetical protein
LMLTRPDESLLIVTWQSNSATPKVPTMPTATDWTGLLRAAGIPTP